MRLKRLEIYGYKSFASRAVFEFGKGLTAIVGPNGSGKSNIADALRWALGEQSNRALRARTSEDMIYAGSPRRPRLGMAEVILTLDNSSHWLPIDYTEVTIGRRAYRSGENEYLLNGNRVRYRDILDLLEQAGLGRSNYLVIGQGMVDDVLSLRPEARRALFEEAAGIGPHLRKREEALRRIEETERNLQRVSDILAELRPRAGRLRRQAERAEEYLLLSQDLQELQRIWYGYQWQKCQHELGRAQQQLAQLRAQLDSQRLYTRELEKRREQLAGQRTNRTRLLAELHQQQAELHSASEALHRELAVLRERERLTEQQCRALASEGEALSSQRDVLRQEIARLEEELATQEEALAAGEVELEAVREELADTRRTAQLLQEQVEELQARLLEITTALSDGQARLQHWSDQRATWTVEYEEAQKALDDLANRAQRLENRGQRLADEERNVLQEQEALRQQRAKVEERLPALQEQMRTAEADVARSRAERDRLLQRRDALAQLREELTGYLPGVRAVLGEATLAGILGTAANLMTVPRELELAIEAALGTRLQHIVTARWEDAEAAIAFLKRSRAGWATFLPLDTIRPRSVLRLAPQPDLVGVASDLVRYEERVRPAIELLLGRVVVLRHLSAARQLLRQRTGASLYVTLEGETVQASGAVSGGVQARRSNLLAQEREWRELPERIATAEAALKEAVGVLREYRAELEGLRAKQAELDRQLQNVRQAREMAHEAVVRHEQEMRALARERHWQEARLTRVRESLAKAESEEGRLHALIANAQTEQQKLLGELATMRERLALLESDQVRQRSAEIETRVAVGQRTVDSQRRLLASHQRNLEQLEAQRRQKQAQGEQLQRDLVTMREMMATSERRIEALQRQLADRQEAERPHREEIERLDREQEDLEHKHAQSLERLHDLELEYNRASLDRDHIRDQQAALAHEIEENLGPVEFPETVSHQLRLNLNDNTVELPRVSSPPPGLTEEIRQLKARMRRLGSVNPEAPREYERLLERQTFLESQAADLRGAIGALYEVIEELDAIIEEDFASTVRQVDAAFGECFQELFNGGTARLVLTDPDDLSTTGVEIIARPPGKRAQSLSLLSGGERALTAVALLFALLRVNPVPFSFLDEVDAALDEANVGRFRDLLLAHADRTQFVVITHNRTTVEAASTIYGISMGEQGVSECLSLKVEDPPQPAATTVA